MRIALMTNNYKPFIGGVPISIERLADGLKKLGHEVTVFAPSYKEQEDEKDIFRYRSLIEGVAGGIVIPSPIDLRIEKEFRQNHYDIIHVHHPMLIGKTAVYLSKKYDIPLVFTYHTRYEQYLHYFMPKAVLKQKKIMNLSQRMVSKYLKSFFKNCHHVFAPTEGIKRYLTDSTLYGGNVTVLPTGLDNSSFEISKEDTDAVRRRYDAVGMPLFSTVSRIAHEKNIPFLLESICRFKEKYHYSFKVLIIGEGPNKNEYIEKCIQLGISENVIFTGAVPNEKLAAYYRASDAFLFASKTETQGIVLLESFAAGTPVIGVEASGVSDLVKDNENGCLVPENTDIFSDKMLLPVTDKMLLLKLKEGALQTAKDFRESKVADTAASQYNRVVIKYHSDKEAEQREAESWKISTVS